MSGTADDPIDLEALNVTIAAANRPDSTVDDHERARRAMIEKLNYLEGGHETPKATHQLASAYRLIQIMHVEVRAHVRGRAREKVRAKRCV